MLIGNRKRFHVNFVDRIGLMCIKKTNSLIQPNNGYKVTFKKSASYATAWVLCSLCTLKGNLRLNQRLLGHLIINNFNR